LRQIKMEQRPTDDQILSQQELIEQETCEKPFICDLEPISSLTNEYKDANPIFLTKIENLQRKYSHMRRVRRDGNCFYRAFMFGYLEHLIKTRNKVQLQALLKLMEGSLEELFLVGGYPQMTIEDFYETTREEVEQAASGDLPVEELLQHFRDYSTTNAIVMFLRLITATSLKKHADHFTPFLDNGLNISQFCRRLKWSRWRERQTIVKSRRCREGWE